MIAYVLILSMGNKIKTMRLHTPHPVDLRELKAPLMQISSKKDLSLAWIVRDAVKEYLQKYYPEFLNTK